MTENTEGRAVEVAPARRAGGSDHTIMALLVGIGFTAGVAGQSDQKRVLAAVVCAIFVLTLGAIVTLRWARAVDDDTTAPRD